MKRRVFITGCSFRAPGLKDFGDVVMSMTNPAFSAPFQKIAVSDERETHVATLDLETTSPHYPSGSQLKLMRADVIAAVICAAELVEKAGMDAAGMPDMPLYISNGSSFDLGIEQLAEITSAFLKRSPEEDWSSRYRRVHHALPPMYVLRTLANAGECFVSQQTGARGDNATFGGSSHATYLALQEVMRRIETRESEMALFGACNGINLFSILAYANHLESGSQWRECEGAGFLLIESEESLSRSGRRPLAEIVSLQKSTTIPGIFCDDDTTPPYNEFPGDPAGYCIYSGGLSETGHERQKAACSGKWERSFSWFPQLGILGNQAVLMNIATAIALFQHARIQQADCVNRDAYERESLIRLQAVGS